MKLAGAASWIHKWLALIVGVQVLFWVVSGLFFALFPIEQVRSEHRIARSAALEAAALPTVQEVTGLLSAAPVKLTYERNAMGGAVAVAEFADAASPAVVDLARMQVMSPLDESAARAMASAHIKDPAAIVECSFIRNGNPEYRGALPAWRVAFEDGLAVYVAADTGRVTARRSNLWRLYDALWALHIMDWRDHENFNNGLLIAFSAMSLIVVIAGFILFPYRLRFGARRRDA